MQDLEEEQEEEDTKPEEEETTPEPGSTLDYHRFSHFDGELFLTWGSYRFDEQVNLVLKSSDPEKLPELSRKFVRVSALATITHLKKFIAIKVLNMPKDDEDIFRWRQ